MTDQDFRVFIDQLKDRVRGQDIAAKIGLRGRGKRFFCPSCQPDGGKTPDLDVFELGFKCYKCGKTGDIIDLAVFAGGMSKADAIEYLAGMAGMKVQKTSRKGPGHPSGRPKIVRPGASHEAKKAVMTEKPVVLAERPILDLFDAFMNAACRAIQGTPADDYLTGRGIDAGTADRAGVRFCPDIGVLWTLADRTTIKASGLAGLYVFQKAGLPVLVFPYLRAGRPVFIKVRCLLSKDDAVKRQVPRFLNTAGRVPCLWNHDAVAAADRVLVCEGEIDALTAIQAGETGVGLPGWSHWKDEWIRDFAGKDVVLVLDADEGGRKGTADIARRFIRAGYPAPRQLVLDEGQDLNEFYLLTGGRK